MLKYDTIRAIQYANALFFNNVCFQWAFCASNWCHFLQNSSTIRQIGMIMFILL